MLEGMDEELQRPQQDNSDSEDSEQPRKFLEVSQESSANQQPQGRGRPIGSKNRPSDPEVMLKMELLSMLKLAQLTRKYAEAALQRVAEAAEGADSIKTKAQIAELLVTATERLTKCAGAIIEQLKKQPATLGEGGKDETAFNVEEWIKTL